jgi:hypothetical protein
MRARNFTKHERKILQAANVKEAMAGEGMYLFENNTNADLALPRPTKSGCRSVGPKAQFQGDNYYMQLVQKGYLRLIKVLQTPEQERATEVTMEQENEKLILDQPEIVTEHGEVEHVINADTPIQQLDEGDDQPKPDVLLNESPIEDGFVIID